MMWDVNWIAVVVGTIVGMVVGMIWFSPFGFGNLWMRLSGITQKQVEGAKKKGMAAQYFWQIAGTLVMTYVLAIFIKNLGLMTLEGGAIAGFWIWLGFIATTSLTSVLWEGKSFKLYLFNNAQRLVHLLIVGALIGFWG